MFVIMKENRYLFWHESFIRSGWYLVAWFAAATKFRNRAAADDALILAQEQGFRNLRVAEV